MPGIRKNKWATVAKVTDAAEAAGYIVWQNPDRSNGELALEMSTNPGQIQFSAFFRQSDVGYWNWERGQQYSDGDFLRIYAMERFIERLSHVDAR
jgi:hypothetical protein